MPANLDDYSKEDPDSAQLDASTGGGSAPAGGAAGGQSGGGGQGPKVEQASAQEQQPYVPWSSFVSANQGVSDAGAAKLQNQVQGDVNSATSDTNAANSAYNGAVNADYGNGPKSLLTPGMSSADVLGSTTAQPAPNAQSPSSMAHRAVANPAAPPSAPARDTPAQPTTPSNPWASFLPNQAAPPPGPKTQPGLANAPQMAAKRAQESNVAGEAAAGRLEPTVASTSAPNPIQQTIARQNSLTGAALKGSGPHGDLETSMGPGAWNQLLGKAQNAGNEANALGSEAGVQALLQQNNPAIAGYAAPSSSGGPNQSAFDAALINGSGQQGFQALNKQYGNGQLVNNLANDEGASQQRWSQLQGDVARQNSNVAASQAAGTTVPSALSAGPSAIGQNGTASTPNTSGNGPSGVTFTSTSGANGQFDASQVPQGFDPSTSPTYQSALTALNAAAPLPPFANSPSDFLAWASQPGTGQQVWNEWSQELGLTGDQLRNAINGMPSWEWQMFARGIIPSGLRSSTATGYFEGFAPTSTTGTGAGSNTNHTYDDAMNALQSAVLGVSGVAGPLAKATQGGIQTSVDRGNNSDPFGNRG